MGTPVLLLLCPPTRKGPAERSLTGAPRHASRGATSCCRSRSPGLPEAAGLVEAVERLASRAVLGEAPEDLRFTLGAPDRVRNFSAPMIGGCTSERASDVRAEPPAARTSDARSLVHPPIMGEHR